MGRAKGGTNRRWSASEKYNIILPIINGEMSGNQRAKNLGLAQGMVKKWVIAYNKGGIEALENKMFVSSITRIYLFSFSLKCLIIRTTSSSFFKPSFSGSPSKAF